MRRGSLLLIGITSAIATVISLNVIFGRSWNYYDRYYGYHGRYCKERHYREGNRNNEHEQRDPGADSATGKY